MGNIFARLIHTFRTQRENRIITLGLDGAGKTTFLYKLKLGDDLNTIPTIGFNVETIQFGNVTLNLWDIGGQKKIRDLWAHYYPGTGGIIFLVDSSDRARINLVKEELHKLLNEEDLMGVPLLILANKQDLGVMEVSEVIERLELSQIRGREWFCQGCSCKTGTGLYEGMNWFTKALNKKK
jgi:small GTP-binding protein